MRRSVRSVLALTAVAAMIGSTGVDGESRYPLTVRIYNATVLPATAIAGARRAAEPILRDTGLDVTFRFCGARRPMGSSADSCDDALKPHEVVVRIVDAPPVSTSLDPLAFGLTYVVPETDRGWLATVFADRTLATASRVGIDGGTLVGLVMAHEVGHLLLGQRYHGDAGVMRPQWPDALLARNAPADWYFSMREAAVIQRRLQTR